MPSGVYKRKPFTEERKKNIKRGLLALPTSHGLSYTKFHYTWNAMKQRCINTATRSYKNYGGRGIRVCSRWFNFKNFHKDTYESYLKHVKEFGEKNTTIDRIDSNGNYNFKNCRWSTPKIQQNNKTSNNRITYNNQTKTVTQWEEQLGLGRGRIQERISMGWSIEEALTTPTLIKYHHKS